MSLLEIKNLKSRVDDREILKGINLTINPGEVHSIMGPNGSGKSTLAQVLARRETYEVTGGEVLFNGKNLLDMKAEEAACEGLFLAFQYPVEIPGISNAYFLRSALNAIRKYRGEEEMDAMDFLPLMREKLKLLDMDEKLMNRSVNEVFLGRREEAQRDSADGGAAAEAGHSRRNRFGPRYRRAAHRRARRERDAQPRSRHSGGDALPAPAELHRSGPCARAASTGASCAPAVPNSRWSSKKKAMRRRKLARTARRTG